jgi:16S rRNA (cytosine1402-N4)-methyltransferase
MTAAHVPVLLSECLHWLDPHPSGRFVDCTLGAGGHAVALLDRTAPTGSLLALDADPESVRFAEQSLAAYGSRVEVVHSSFRYLAAVADRFGFSEVDGVLMDLGLSSVQLATSTRGFAFSLDGPLDMRFDPTTGRTAAELLASEPQEEIERIIRTFGEEPRARFIAKSIVRARAERPIDTTGRLADVVMRAAGAFRGRIHPATRVFQALRIAVNEELTALSEALPQALGLLRHQGRLAVISFHSLEDRIVKTFLRERAGLAPPEEQRALPLRPQERVPEIRLLSKHPIAPGAEELAANPRSRSAHLRVAERL